MDVAPGIQGVVILFKDPKERTDLGSQHVNPKTDLQP